MATKNPRINITFEEDTVNILNSLAKQEHKTTSDFIRELVFEALSRREDMVLSAIAELRDTQHAKMVDHDDAWK
jgi:predicted DNA-binding protein